MNYSAIVTALLLLASSGLFFSGVNAGVIPAMEDVPTTVEVATENTEVVMMEETQDSSLPTEMAPSMEIKDNGPKKATSTAVPASEKTLTEEEKAIEKLNGVSDNVVETDDQVVDDFETWEAPEDIRKNYPYYLSGFDDENRPIWIAEFGRYDIRKLVEEGGQRLKDFDKYAQQAAYRILKSVKLRSTPEEPVTEANFIVDFDEFKLSTVAHVPTLSYIVHLAKLYRDLIEKHIHIGVGVNANFVAERLIGLTRPVFGAIMEKIEIHGSNRARWIAQLKRHFPMDQLPEWYGGRKGYQPLRVYG